MSQSDLHKQLFHWQGRHDPEEGKDGRRVHHIVQHKATSELDNNGAQGISILGFATDAGVARNKGRIGAKKAPDLIRRALANLAWHKDTPIYDLGTVVCEDDLLEESQARCAKTIAQALPHTSVIVLGGGHEIAWASFSGLAEYFKTHHPDKKPKIGIVNFDAHFNLRAFDSSHADSKPSSGTPFNQIHHFCQQNDWTFHYACLGVSRSNNTLALFHKADELCVWYVEDHQLNCLNHSYHLTQLQHFIDDCDYLYLTIDLGVFPAATAPGVSAPAARGVSYDTIAPFLERILHYKNKLLLADIAEYNPNYDVDSQTARLAAYLCWEIANAMAEKQNT
ncbi:Catalyzes the conversion of N-formimidoyl-L-glutamate to L-glutamate and formamide [Vibrio sp. B1FLJ16]|uniref:formimidoylglutamase n=1 Tax=Vibrio sp. B1FLJ16 TaxID=2751178 RepID=UPI0015F5EFCF|nr:formimidoylglutamase [Vibrio sp. B1FLJ16]CAD7804426.1 Catalyzes the conversion of N-formimidoyl-L-glutamate to L-glutamate and formamide [Vibrio sp. B1FLJ16]CAE6897306.1 Catalyzes the conversion of N-formimidoyl-L-glutamate to L-glutamate and formamide [Vibrio sp. B1FLJ16]